MSRFSANRVDTEALISGRWEETGCGDKYLIAKIDTDEYLNALQEEQELAGKHDEDGQLILTLSQARNSKFRAMARTVLKDWQGKVDGEGNKIPYSTDRAYLELKYGRDIEIVVNKEKRDEAMKAARPFIGNIYDLEKVKNGVWVPMEGGGECRIGWAESDPFLDAYALWRDALTVDGKTSAAHEREALHHALTEGVLLEWRDVPGEDGELTPYDAERAFEEIRLGDDYTETDSNGKEARVQGFRGWLLNEGNNENMFRRAPLEQEPLTPRQTKIIVPGFRTWIEKHAENQARFYKKKSPRSVKKLKAA